MNNVYKMVAFVLPLSVTCYRIMYYPMQTTSTTTFARNTL